MASHQAIVQGLILVLFMLVIFIAAAQVIERKKLKIGHETGVVMLAGLAISLVMYMSPSNSSNDFIRLVEFDEKIFFYIILPPILFASGYNMYRKKFFTFIVYITLFGVVGTLITYAIFSSLTYLGMQHF